MWTAGTDRPLEDMAAMMAYVVKFQNDERTDCLKQKGRRYLGIDTQSCSWVSTLTWTMHKCIYPCMQTHTENTTQQNTNLSIFNYNFSFLLNIFFALWDYVLIHPSSKVLPGELKHFFLSLEVSESPEREKIQGKRRNKAIFPAEELPPRLQYRTSWRQSISQFLLLCLLHEVTRI